MNLAVPDELYKRYQAVKDDIDNASAIFQQALERKIEMIEALKNSTSDLDKTIARLKNEKENNEDQVFKEGKLAGLKKAPDISYEDFLELEELYNGSEARNRSGLDLKIEDFPDNIADDLQYYDFIGDTGVFLNGYLEGLIDFWDKVKEKI